MRKKDKKIEVNKEEVLKDYESPELKKIKGHDEESKKIELGCYDCGPDSAHC